MKSRTRARSIALQVLYEIDMANHPPAEVLRQRLEEAPVTEDLADFARQIVFGVLPLTHDLDQVIARYAPEWPLDQIAAIDRNILRVALHEIQANLAPTKVVINEAIEIAKERGYRKAMLLPVSGLVHVVRKGKGFLVINQVDLEEYVKGVVPAEVNSAWHPEMLKAQAVAARTYALYQQMLSAAREYDVAATVQDQVYKGKNGIDTAVLRAVDETRGLVLKDPGGNVVEAFFTATCGGHSTLGTNIFPGGPVSALFPSQPCYPVPEYPVNGGEKTPLGPAAARRSPRRSAGRSSTTRRSRGGCAPASTRKPVSPVPIGTS